MMVEASAFLGRLDQHRHPTRSHVSKNEFVRQADTEKAKLP